MITADFAAGRKPAWLLAVLLAALCTAWLAPAPAYPAETAASAASGLFEVALAGPAPLRPPRLASVTRRHAAEMRAAPPCRRSLFRRCPLADWRRALDRLAGAAPLARIAAVNRYVNRVPYVADAANYGVGDYWATPAEFLRRGGDCEDYAIAKYLSLRALGIADADLRIVALYDMNQRIHHAVLTVRVDGRTLVLDNRTARILPLDAVEGYRPIYSINEAGWWLHRS